MVATRQKYNATSVYYHQEWKRTITPIELEQFRDLNRKSLKQQNILYFASRFEYKVYRALTDLFGVDDVVCQVPVPIYPPTSCCPNGKRWVVDFLVKANQLEQRQTMFIEAKGVVTTTFMDSLVALELHNLSVFDSLYLLFDRAIPEKNRVIKNLLHNGDITQSSHPRHRILLLSDFVQQQLSK